MIEPPVDKGLDSLHPAFRAKLEELLRRLEKAGIPFRPSETRRTAARQAWLFAAGRTRPGAKVTQKDGKPGVYPKDYEVIPERGRSRQSRHQSGLAADIYPVKPDGRIWTPDSKHEIWKLMNTHAKALGLRCGGGWGDWPHVEWQGALPKQEPQKAE